MKNLSIIILLSLITATSVSQDVSGNWIGQLKYSGGQLDVAFKIVKHGDLYESAMDIPAQGLSDFKAASTVVQNDTITISFPNFNLEYKGSIKVKNEIIGSLYKDNIPAPLDLQPGEIKLNRPQEPKAPFNYYSEDITFSNADNLKLAGTLTLPTKEGKYPVVIIISGTGPHNRDGEMYKHKPYFVIADELTKNGIGVLRFDERGVGASEGTFESATVHDFSSDIESAIVYLKTRKEINPKKIGLLGHSIGGLIAPKIASENKSVNFIVLLAGPGVNGDKLILSQKAALERIKGFNEAQIAQGQDFVKGGYEIVVESNLDTPALKDSLNSYYNNKYGKLLPENQRKALVDQMTSFEVVGLLKSKPSAYLSKVDCPVLALNGSKDFQVPAKDNLAAIKKTLEANGNKNVETYEFENLNHLFQECKTGDRNEYSEIEQTISPDVLKHITNWVKEQTK